MNKELLKLINKLKKKQLKILGLANKTNIQNLNLKIHDELSPIAWHIIHCIFIEALWIRRKFFNDYYYVKKLRKIGDAINIPLENRDTYLPHPSETISFANKIFNKNILLLENLVEKTKQSNNNLFYVIYFLNNHHAQHIETLKNIVTLINIKFNRNSLLFSDQIEGQKYKFEGIYIKNKVYKIGAERKSKFSYDNEIPCHNINLDGFYIAKNPITISEWMGFIKDGGYKKKKYWSEEGWDWKKKNNIFYPMNWIIDNSKKKFTIFTYNGSVLPLKNMEVSNISKFEIEAFAKYSNCRVPHEFEWEASFKKMKKKYRVWEWCSNEFFGYKGFKPFPYKEYSQPWFKNNYYTLRGGSIITLKDIKRFSFRNFYKPSTRYIMSGGRLALS